MYPPKVQDRAIEALIREMTVAGRMPSGAAIRTELARRFGSRGGVARVYRLLAQARTRQTQATALTVGARLLELDNQTLQQQLRGAQQQAEAQQLFWARKVTQLWGHVQDLGPLIAEAIAAGTYTAVLAARLQEAQTRAGQLEVLLRAFGPATGGPRRAD